MSRYLDDNLHHLIKLVSHGFLIITFFSSLAQVLRDLEDPAKIVQNFSIYVPSTFMQCFSDIPTHNRKMQLLAHSSSRTW